MSEKYRSLSDLEKLRDALSRQEKSPGINLVNAQDTQATDDASLEDGERSRPKSYDSISDERRDPLTEMNQKFIAQRELNKWQFDTGRGGRMSDALKGKRIKEVIVDQKLLTGTAVDEDAKGAEEVTIRFTDNVTVTMQVIPHEHHPWAPSRVEDQSGSLQSLVGGTLISMDEKRASEGHAVFYDFNTDKGFAQLRWVSEEGDKYEFYSEEVGIFIRADLEGVSALTGVKLSRLCEQRLKIDKARTGSSDQQAFGELFFEQPGAIIMAMDDPTFRTDERIEWIIDATKAKLSVVPNTAEVGTHLLSEYFKGLDALLRYSVFDSVRGELEQRIPGHGMSTEAAKEIYVHMEAVRRDQEWSQNPKKIEETIMEMSKRQKQQLRAIHRGSFEKNEHGVIVNLSESVLDRLAAQGLLGDRNLRFHNPYPERPAAVYSYYLTELGRAVAEQI